MIPSKFYKPDTIDSRLATPIMGPKMKHLMANISEKVISILAGDLNSGLRCLITTVKL
jgi:hypothetical protein